MNIFTALEAIAFQSDSKLASRLTDLFQEVIDYRDKIEPKYNLKKIDDINKFIKNLVNFTKKILNKDMTKIIFEEVGISIRKLIFIEPEFSCGMFAIDIIDKNQSLSLLIREIMRGGIDVYEKNDKISDDIKSLTNLEKYLNYETGKVDFRKLKHKIFGELYFDIVTAFAPDIVSLNYKKEDRFIANEITSIIIHEIGHIITPIEYMSYNGYCGTHGTQNINEQMKKNPKELIEKVKDSKVIEKIDKMIEINPDDEGLVYFVKCLSNFFSFIVKHTVNFGASIIIVITQMILTLMIAYMMIGVNIVLIFSFLKHFFPDQTATGRESKTNRHDVLAERLSDEFVSRHGQSHHIASALHKLGIFISNAKYNEFEGLMGDALRANFVMRSFVNFTMALDNILLANITKVVTSNYEADIERCGRLLQNNIAIFKNKNLPASIRDSYLYSTKETLKIIKLYKKQNRSIPSLVKKGIEFILSIVFVPEKLAGIISGDITKSQEKLLNNLDSLMSNRIYIGSAKLDQFIERK